MKPVSLWVAVCLAAALPSLGRSQNAPAGADANSAGPTAEASGGTLSEVVVTAEKFAQDVEKTPVSLEVYTPQQILSQGITDFTKLAAVDASLQINNTEEGYLTMRGVSSTDTTEIGSPSIPVYVDNFVSNRSWTLNADLFDVQNIQVLRGPQGTLYGRSSTGGAINIVTNQPSKSFEAMAMVQYGNYNTINSTGVLNIPVADAFQARLAVNYLRHDGYFGTVVGESGANPAALHGDDADDRALRFSTAFEPFEHFKATLIYEETHIGGLGAVTEVVPGNYVGCVSYLPPCPDTAESGNGGPDISHLKPPLTPNSFPIYGQPWQDIYSKIGKWNLVYDGLPAGMSLTFDGGYGIEAYHHLGAGGVGTFSYSTCVPYRPTCPNYGNAAFGLGAPTFPLNGAFPPIGYDQNEVPHTTNAELRLASSQMGRFVWQAGLYYFQENNNLDSHTQLNLETPAVGPSVIIPGLPDNRLIEFIFPSVYQYSRAVYGQTSIQLGENGKLELGARYNADGVLRSGNSLFNIYYAGVRGIKEGGAQSSTRITWHGGYDYQLLPTDMLYAKVDSGYKPGGFDTCGEYLPTTVTTAEIGNKGRFNDGHIQWNIDGFYDDYTNMQVAQFESTCLTGTHTTNAGKSRIYGAETDATLLFAGYNRFDVNASYLHARFVNFSIPPNIGASALADCPVTVKVGAGTNCVLDGYTLPYSPTLTLIPAIEHDFMLPGNSTLSLRVDAKYSSTVYFNSFDYPDVAQGAYTVGDVYLNFTRDNWTVGLYDKNFTNRYYLNSASETTGGGNIEKIASYAYSWGDPRTFGVQVQLTMH